jgi:hypothetical protein
MSVLPHQRSLQWLRKQGYVAVTVESWKRFPDFKKRPCPVCKGKPMISTRADLMGFADILAMHPLLKEVWLVQVTDRAHAANRIAKMTVDPKVAPNVKAAQASGIRTAVHSWALQGARGGKKRWILKIEEVN